LPASAPTQPPQHPPLEQRGIPIANDDTAASQYALQSVHSYKQATTIDKFDQPPAQNNSTTMSTNQLSNTLSSGAQITAPPDPGPDDRDGRENWDKSVEFLLAVVGFAVDLGNIWRFPYICYRNGGGAFLIPYMIMFALGGLPIFYLEMSLGQYFASGCLTVWRRVCPIVKGIGYSMCLINFFTGLYYNTIISWAVYYLVESFTYELPWTSCYNSWNTPNCRTIEQRAVRPGQQLSNVTNLNTTSPAEEFFEREVLKLHLSNGIDDIGSIRWPLAMYLAIVFIFVYFAIWKGVKSTGKAVWITALLPYFVLIPLLIRGIFLEGASVGIKYYLYPDWTKLLVIDVWIDAAKQIFFSLGPGFGTLLALSSYNKFNHNCFRDALIAASVNCFTSFIAGFVIFSVLGYMATIQNKDISSVATDGPGLVFYVYPEAIATMKGSSFWSIIFFIMVITLGIDSTFGGLEAVITGLCDEYPNVLRRHREIFIGCLIFFIYVCSLPTTTHGGNYVISLLDAYGTSLSLLFIVFIETSTVCWVYGVERFSNNLEEMLHYRPGLYWRICWRYISPTILLFLFCAAIWQEKEHFEVLILDGYVYPPWSVALGGLMTLVSLICIPSYAIHYLATSSGSFYQRLKSGMTPVKG
ncbi:Sodium-dependent serotonin transporter, partial [Fragariocoptes setiger]